MITGRLVLLVAFGLMAAGIMFTIQSTQTATGGPSSAQRRELPAPSGESALCAGSDAARCVDAIERALQERGPAGKSAVLAPPLVDLGEAQQHASEAGRTISEPGPPWLPKSARDLIENRLMHVDQAGRVQVFVEAKRSVDETADSLRAAGATVEREEQDYDIVQAWLPIDQLETIGASDQVEEVRLPDYGFVSTGSVTSQADALLGVANARSTFGVDGSGVRVGVLSDGVQGIGASQASGDLPSVNTTMCNEVPQSPSAVGAGAEGTAMLEIVHDLAPGAELWFGHFGFGFTGTIFDFLDAVNCLALNTDVVVDDIYFLNQGLYDGTSAVSMNAANALNDPANRAKGYFNAVGNQAVEHYQGPFRDSLQVFGVAGFHVFEGVPFVTSDQFGNGQDIGNGTFLLNGEALCLFLQWNDPWTGSNNNYDLYLVSSQLLSQTGGNIIAATVAQSERPQTGSQSPSEELCYVNDALSDGFFFAVIRRFQNEQVRTFDMFMFCTLCAPLPDGLFGQPFFNYNTACNSVPNNSDARNGVVALAAIEAADPGLNDREPYSSCGPTNDGRMKPELTALDGVNVTANGGFFTPFYGTSAAAPHAAAIAALVLDCEPTLNDAQLRTLLFNHADDLAFAGPDNAFGHGRIDVAGALTKDGCQPPTPTPTPTVTVTPTETPSPTAKNLAGDTDGDTVTNDLDDNDDNDGCTDEQETGLVATAGGLRDPHNFWDFFDVPTGAGPARDQAISSPDIFAVMARFNSSGDSGSDPLSPPPASPAYHTAYDRGPVIGANNWNVGPANGSIAATDIFAVLSQFNHSC